MKGKILGYQKDDTLSSYESDKLYLINLIHNAKLSTDEDCIKWREIIADLEDINRRERTIL